MMLLAIMASAAMQAESWTCSYPGALGGAPAVARFARDGDDLVETDLLNLRFRIVRDDTDALVAVDASTWASDGQTHSGANVINIDKHSGAFLRAELVAPSEGAARIVRGTCLAV